MPPRKLKRNAKLKGISAVQLHDLPKLTREEARIEREAFWEMAWAQHNRRHAAKPAAKPMVKPVSARLKELNAGDSDSE